MFPPDSRSTVPFSPSPGKESVESRVVVQALPSGERLIAEMDQPDAAETAAAASTSAGAAGEAHQPAPPGQEMDAEAAGLASSQTMDVQAGNAHSTAENEPAMAAGSGDAKQKPPRRELKPLVPCAFALVATTNCRQDYFVRRLSRALCMLS